MKLIKAGEKGKAICEACAKVVGTTYVYRDIPFSNGSGLVNNVLAGVCDECDRVIVTPAQSTPAIKVAREVANKPVEVSLPAYYVEILDLAAFKINPDATTEFRKRLVVYYIHDLIENNGALNQFKSMIEKFSRKFASKSKIPTKRLSFKVSKPMDQEFLELMDLGGLKKTELIKGAIIQIDRDIVQRNKPRRLAELQRLAAVTAA